MSQLLNPPASELALTSLVEAKPTYSLFCGVDVAAKTFTAAICIPGEHEEPSKAANFKQTPQDFEALKNTCSKGYCQVAEAEEGQM